MERRPDLIVKRMEALVLHGIGDLRLEQIPVPHLAEGEVRVRIGFVVSAARIFREFLSKALIVSQRSADMNLPVLSTRAVLGLKVLTPAILSLSFRCSGVVSVRRVSKESMFSATTTIISVLGVTVPLLNMSSPRSKI